MFKRVFATPLPSTARSSEYGFPGDHFDLPTPVLEDEVAYPDFSGVADGPSEFRSNTGELFQNSNPAYAGEYRLEFQNDAGVTPTFTEQVASPGSESLLAPRNDGGIQGTNRIIHSTGPVGGMSQDGFTGDRAALYKPNPNYGGPVSGGPDYASQLHNAYFSQLAAQYSAEASAAAMVSAV